MLRAVAGPGGEDVVGALEESPIGVEDAGGLLAGHGMAADEVHLVGQHSGGVYNGGFDAAHVGDQAAGLEVQAVAFEKVHNGTGVETEVDQVGVGDGRPGVVGEAVGHTVGGGKLQSGVRIVYSHDLKVLKASEGHGHRAAD